MHSLYHLYIKVGNVTVPSVRTSPSQSRLRHKSNTPTFPISNRLYRGIAQLSFVRKRKTRAVQTKQRKRKGAFASSLGHGCFLSRLSFLIHVREGKHWQTVANMGSENPLLSAVWQGWARPQKPPAGSAKMEIMVRFVLCRDAAALQRVCSPTYGLTVSSRDAHVLLHAFGKELHHYSGKPSMIQIIS